MATEKERKDRLDRARLKVLFNVPFFAPGVARLPVEFADTLPDGTLIPTACTEGSKILWNPEWFDGLKDEELVTVYCEEVGHCLFGHLWRRPASADGQTWNIACDCAVRNMMEDFGAETKGKGYADPFPFPDKDKLFPHALHKNKSEEQIYRELYHPQNQPKPKTGSGQGSGGKSSPQSKPGAGKGNPGGGQTPNGKQPAQPPPFAEFEPAPKAASGSAQSSQNQKSMNSWRATMIQSAHMAKSRGTIPLGIDRMIGEMLNPEVPWQEILRSHLRELSQDDWDYMKPDIALSDSSGFVMPSLNSERMSSVVFGIDTSGSIDHKLLRAFKTEEQSCLDDMKPSKLVEICCDSKIHQIREYRSGETIDGNAPGGGGTTLSKIFEHLEEQQEHPKCLVILTDLETDFPKQEPNYPVIWVTYGTDKEAPFGLTVRVK